MLRTEKALIVLISLCLALSAGSFCPIVYAVQEMEEHRPNSGVNKHADTLKSGESANYVNNANDDDLTRKNDGSMEKAGGDARTEEATAATEAELQEKRQLMYEIEEYISSLHKTFDFLHKKKLDRIPGSTGKKDDPIIVLNLLGKEKQLKELVDTLTETKAALAKIEADYSANKDKLSVEVLRKYHGILQKATRRINELYQAVAGKNKGGDFATREGLWYLDPNPPIEGYPKNAEEDDKFDAMDRYFYISNDNTGEGLDATIKNFTVERKKYDKKSITFLITFNKDGGPWIGGGFGWKNGVVNLCLPLSKNEANHVKIIEREYDKNNGKLNFQKEVTAIDAENEHGCSNIHGCYGILENKTVTKTDSTGKEYKEMDKSTDFYREESFYTNTDTLRKNGILDPGVKTAAETVSGYLNNGIFKTAWRVTRPVKQDTFFTWEVTFPIDSYNGIDPSDTPIGVTFSNRAGKYQRSIWHGPFGMRGRHFLKRPETIYVRNKHKLTQAERKEVKDKVFESTIKYYKSDPKYNDKVILSELTDAHSHDRDPKIPEKQQKNYMHVRENGDVGVKFPDYTFRFLHNNDPAYTEEDHKKPIMNCCEKDCSLGPDHRPVLTLKEERKITDPPYGKAQNSQPIDPRRAPVIFAYDKENQFDNDSYGKPNFNALTYEGYSEGDSADGKFFKGKLPNGLKIENVTKNDSFKPGDGYRACTRYETKVTGQVKGIEWKPGETQKVYNLKFRSEDKWYNKDPNVKGVDGDYTKNFAECQITIVVQKDLAIIPVGNDLSGKAVWQGISSFSALTGALILYRRKHRSVAGSSRRCL